MYTDILSKDLGEFGNREVPTATNMRFYGDKTSFLFAFLSRISSPKKFPSPKRKLTPEERLRRYVEFKYGKLDVWKKKIVEKKS